MTSRLRQLAEHLSTMETGWRRYAWATAAGLFTALGATAYSLEQSWFGATFFVFAIALLVMSGWSRWYLRTHRRPGSYVGEDGPELLDPRLLATGGPVSPEQIEILRRRLAERPCGLIWLPPNATPESSPPPTDFPGVEGGEFQPPPDEASRLRRERRILGLPGGDLTEGGSS